jgi:RHS repeat-associated protein
MNADGTTGSTYLYSVMYYDSRGRLIQTKSNNHLTGGIEKEYIAYNFTGQPTQRKHIHQATGKNTQTEVYAYTYDHAGRLLTTTHQLTDGTTVKPQVTLAENSYDDLGRLKTNKKGGVAGTLATYAYNIRSWTKSITSPLFTETLYYNESYGGSVKQYNGNISAMSWKQLTEPLRYYAYSYDNLSRLTNANYGEDNSATNRFTTSYSYDKQGNMKTLTRRGNTDGSGTNGMVDNLTMTHNGNQLAKVSDTGVNVSMSSSMDFKDYSNVATEYTYNANGAMNKDLNKGISDIQYNSLNLPRMMDIKSPVAEARNEYTYSTSGQKLKVVQKWNPNFSTAPVIGSGINTASLTQAKTTDYIGNIIYENNALKRILVEGGYYEGGVYYYYLADHLGNNHVVVKSDGISIQSNSYYPFGMHFAPGIGYEKQPYKYNNKELDQMHGLNMYDYSARHLALDVPRFTTVDPLAELYYSISPYAYCNNNPIKFIDPTGLGYTYVYPNEEKDEKGGYYVNDDGERVEWEEVFNWLVAENDEKTDQDDEWGTLTLFANPGNGSFSSQSSGWSRFGHSWLSLTSDEGKKKTFGTFKKGVVKNGWNPGKTFQINYERDNLYEAYKNLSTSAPITKKQRLLIDLFNLLKGNTDWANGYNCTDYAVEMWNIITHQNLYPESGYRKPTDLYNILKRSIPIYLPTPKK